MPKTPFPHPGCRVQRSVIYGNLFPRASWNRWVTCRKVSPMWIEAKEKCHQFWHRQILDYTSICQHTTYYEHLRLHRNDDHHFHFICWADIDIARKKRLQCGDTNVQEMLPISTRHWHILNYSTTRHRTTCFEHLCVTGKWQSFTSFVKWKSTLLWRSVSNFDIGTNTPSHTHAHSRLLEYPPPNNRLRQLGCEWKMMMNTSTSFVEQKSILPQGSVSNSDTYSTTHDWDCEAGYKNQQCSCWWGQYLSCSKWQVLQANLYVLPRYRSQFIRTVCHLFRAGWPEVQTVEAASTIDYRVYE